MTEIALLGGSIRRKRTGSKGNLIQIPEFVFCCVYVSSLEKCLRQCERVDHRYGF